MSLLLIALAFVAFAAMLSQFGGRVAARSAPVWWLVAVLLLGTMVFPGALRPVADALGIEFISNLVLATLVVFLMYQSMEQVADTTDATRRLRRITSRMAAERFLGQRGPAAAAPEILVVLPCFQEEANLPATLGAMKALAATTPGLDWCVVDDGSTDASLAILRREAPNNHAFHLSNAGVSGVLLTGMEVADGLGAQWVVQCDSDGQHPFERVPELVEAAKAAGLDLVVGSRYVEGGPADASSTPMRRFGGWTITAMLRIFGLAGRVTDPTSGFRAYSRRAQQVLRTQMPDEYPEPETLAILALAGSEIGEHPVRMLPRGGGTSSIAPMGAARFMIKVLTALMGLRLRSLVPGSRRAD